MTVKELKEKLDLFPDNCTVMLSASQMTLATMLLNVSQGVNELDGLVFLDDYLEDD